MTARAADQTKRTGRASRLAVNVTSVTHRLYAMPCDVWGIGPRGCDFLAKFTKFSIVGGSGVLVNSLALFLLYDKVHLPLVVASALAVELAIANNFFFNNRWTFRAGTLLMSRFAKFNVVSLGGLAITTATLWTLATHFGFHYMLANLVGIALATVWNFAVNFKWTWGWK